MIEILIESNVLVLFIIIFRKIFYKFFSAKVMYEIWILVVIRMLPIELLFGVGKQTVILNFIGAFVSWIFNVGFIRMDFSVVKIPWYLVLVWGVGSIATFLWEYRVNFQFEKYLLKNRIRLPKETCGYSVFQVPDLYSSCVFKVKGEYGIYVGKDVLDNQKQFQTVLTHEICHIESKDLLWARVRMIAMAIGWFSPLIWIAAILSKDDCEMACDEKTIKRMKIKKLDYGEILLEMVSNEKKESRNLLCQAALISPTAHGLKMRIEKIVAKHNKVWLQKTVEIVFGVSCFILFFYCDSFLRGMNGEEVIQQYVYYSNQNYQIGMQQLCLYNEWDYFFYPRLSGDIISIKKCDNLNIESKSFQQETYKVITQKTYNGEMKQYEEKVILVKEKRDGDWKIDWEMKT